MTIVCGCFLFKPSLTFLRHYFKNPAMTGGQLIEISVRKKHRPLALTVKLLGCKQSTASCYSFLSNILPENLISVFLVSLLPEKRLIQAQTEKEGIESDLSSMFPKVRNSSSPPNLIISLLTDMTSVQLKLMKFTTHDPHKHRYVPANKMLFRYCF